MYSSHTLSKRIPIIFAGLFLALAWTSSAFTASDKRADTEALTHSLVGLNNAYQKATAGNKSQALQKLIDATVERQATLAELIKSDPGAVLRVAIPARVRNGMPVEVREFIEQRVELEGELEVKYEDFEDGSHRLRHTLMSNSERIGLHFKSPPSGLLSGMSATVSGVLVDGAMAVESGENDVLTLALGGGSDGGTNGAAPDLSNTFGQQRTAVLLVNFPTVPSEPWTVAEVQDVVFGAVSDFFLENSYGQMWLIGDVFGWFTIQLDPAGCPTTSIAQKAQQAAEESGVDLSAYDRLVYAFPDIGCSWSGEATVGGSPSHAWFDGTLISDGTVSHELGHNLGLHHSHLLDCGAEAVANAGCTTFEYGDALDRMGSASGGHFNDFQKERLGWINYGVSPLVVTADASGTYQLEPVSVQGNGVKGLRILRNENASTGQRTWYYVESRQAVGFDDFLSSSRYGDSVLNGLLIRLGTENDPGSSYLLDMTPRSQKYDWDDLALPMGDTYTDDAVGVSITADWIGPTGAAVTISFDPASCVHADPTLQVSPLDSGWVVPGTPVTYMVSLVNSDSDACAFGEFELMAQIPSSWSAEFADASISLPPGASDSTTFTITSPSNAADGVYDIQLLVANLSDPSYADSAYVTYTVMDETVAGNSPPIAVDDSVNLVQIGSVVINVLANDWDPDNDSIQITAVSQGTKGTVEYNGDGTLTYTPGNRFKNKDSFSYQISDGTESASASVSVSLEESRGGGGGKGGGKSGK